MLFQSLFVVQVVDTLGTCCGCNFQLSDLLTGLCTDLGIKSSYNTFMQAIHFCFLFLFQVITWQDRSEPCYSILVRSRDLSQLLLTFWFSQRSGSGSTLSKVTSSRMEKAKFQLSQQKQQGYILLRVGRGCQAKHRQCLDVPDNSSTSNFLLL